MKVLWLLPPRPAGAPSGGDLYDSLIIAGLRKLGHQVEARTSLPSPQRVRADVVVQDELGFAPFLPFNQALKRAGCGARRVAVVHVTTARLRPGAGTAAKEARYLASAHAAIFVSRQARAESLRLLGGRAALGELATGVISPGADRLKAQRASRAPGALRLLCVAHLLPQKGQLALLDAFAASGLDATLSLAGDGSLDRRYTRQITSRLRTISRAHWVGPLGPAALSRALARADVFINASEYESWGMAAAEAQAAGLPVLSWSKGGLWEFLTPGVDALKVRKPSGAALSQLGEPSLMARLTSGAAIASTRTWALAAREFAAFLETEASAP